MDDSKTQIILTSIVLVLTIIEKLLSLIEKIVSKNQTAHQNRQPTKPKRKR